jgi:ParB-like chromosome segregation protein Spo0J
MLSPTIKNVAVSNLTPHPKNREIYGITVADDFVERVKRLGILEPLIVKADGTIISGHRRWLAARKCGLETVPARLAEFEDELDEIEMLIVCNDQREKTFSEMAAEMAELKRIEEERARRRMEAGKKNDPPENLPEASGDVRDIIAVKYNISGKQVDKMLAIFERAQQGDAEAIELMKALDAGDISVHKAYQTVKGQLDSEKGEKSRITKALEEKKNLDEALQNPLTIEVEKEVFVTPPEVTERLRELETDLSIANERAERLDQKIQEAKDAGKDYESLLQKKMDLHKSIDELLKKNDLAEQERKWALVVVNSAREIRETLNRHKGIIEEASRKGIPAWASASSIKECAERCYEIGDLLSKTVEVIDFPIGEAEYERHKIG